MQRLLFLFLFVLFVDWLADRVFGPGSLPVFRLTLVVAITLVTILSLRMQALRAKIFRHYIAEASRFLRTKIESHRGLVIGDLRVVRGFYKGREIRMGVCLAPGFFGQWSCPIKIRITPHRKKMKKIKSEPEVKTTANTFLSRGVIHYRDNGFNRFWGGGFGWGGLCESFSESKMIEIFDELTRAAETLEGGGL